MPTSSPVLRRHLLEPTVDRHTRRGGRQRCKCAARFDAGRCVRRATSRRGRAALGRMRILKTVARKVPLLVRYAIRTNEMCTFQAHVLDQPFAVEPVSTIAQQPRSGGAITPTGAKTTFIRGPRLPLLTDTITRCTLWSVLVDQSLAIPNHPQVARLPYV
jgi:hypothetical protein